ncbi:hypothetical protein HDU77_001062 [Chytriomyces hyalinus]|nr:hypothetical protein HDU77_001062 [Chytriomyces hyalinus]
MRNSVKIVSLSTALAAAFILLGAVAVTATSPNNQLDHHNSYSGALFKLDGTLDTLSKLTDAYVLVMQVSAVLSVVILAV